MTALWILAALLLGVPLLLGLLLSLPVSVRLRFDGLLQVKLRILGVPVTVFDGSRPAPPPPAEETPDRTSPPSKPREGGLQEWLRELQQALKSEGPAGYAALCRRVAAEGGHVLRRLRQGLSVRRLRLYCPIAGEDAADTALRYGRACGCLYPAQALLEETVRVKRRDIRLWPVFWAEDACMTLDAILWLRPLGLLMAGAGSIFRLWRYTNRKITRYEALQQGGQAYGEFGQ